MQNSLKSKIFNFKDLHSIICHHRSQSIKYIFIYLCPLFYAYMSYIMWKSINSNCNNSLYETEEMIMGQKQTTKS